MIDCVTDHFIQLYAEYHNTTVEEAMDVFVETGYIKYIGYFGQCLMTRPKNEQITCVDSHINGLREGYTFPESALREIDRLRALRQQTC